MDRLNDSDVDTSGRFAYWQQFQLDSVAAGDDDDLVKRVDAEGREIADGVPGEPPGEGNVYLDRRDREHVAYFRDTDGRWKPTRLKRGDDVIVSGMQARCLGPAGGREWAFFYNESWFGQLRLPISVHDVTERAPIDPADQPDMPLFEYAPEQPPPVDPPPLLGASPSLLEPAQVEPDADEGQGGAP